MTRTKQKKSPGNIERYLNVEALFFEHQGCMAVLDKNFRILEQNFEYDLVSASKILEKYIDHPIEIIREDGELVSGTLLSKSSSSLVLKTDNGIKIHPWNDKMTVSVKELPEGLTESSSAEERRLCEVTVVVQSGGAY